MSTNMNIVKARVIFENNDLYELVDDWDADLGECEKERDVTDFTIRRSGVNVSVDCHPDDDETVYIDSSSRELQDLIHGANEYVILVHDNGLHEIWIRGVKRLFLASDCVR